MAKVKPNCSLLSHYWIYHTPFKMLVLGVVWISLLLAGSCGAQNNNCHLGCNGEYHPVCASSGQTYYNKCNLDQVICEKPGILLKYEYKGECRRPEYCDVGEKCLQGRATHPNYEDGLGPVCGSDGRTYHSTCDIDRENCRLAQRFAHDEKRIISIVTHGGCPNNQNFYPEQLQQQNQFTRFRRAPRQFSPRQQFVHRQQYLPPRQHFNAPRQQYRNPQQQYVEPRQQYVEPRQQYVEPRQQYVEPRQQYQKPRQQYVEPRQQYQKPRQQYVEPRQHYVEPRQQYNDPRQQPVHGFGKQGNVFYPPPKDPSGSSPACPTRCPLYYKPVCGTDGNTYTNQCDLDDQNCRFIRRVVKDYDGTCTKTGVQLPVPPDVTAPKVPDLAFPCPLCIEEYHPVCGTDGKSYTSQCHLDAQVCQKGIKVRMAYQGPCAKAKQGTQNYIKQGANNKYRN